MCPSFTVRMIWSPDNPYLRYLYEREPSCNGKSFGLSRFRYRQFSLYFEIRCCPLFHAFPSVRCSMLIQSCYVCASVCHKSSGDLGQARWRGALRLQTHVSVLIAASYAWAYRLHDGSMYRTKLTFILVRWVCDLTNKVQGQNYVLLISNYYLINCYLIII
jgi:hypothetical protein